MDEDDEELEDSLAIVLSSGSPAFTELLPLQGTTSRVWQHFGFPAQDGRFVEPEKKIVPLFIINCAQRC